MNADMPGVGEGILGLLVLLAVLYGARVFFLWYFRINKVIELLTSINRKLGADVEEQKVLRPRLRRPTWLGRNEEGRDVETSPGDAKPAS